jgi:hypothetical protein
MKNNFRNLHTKNTLIKSNKRKEMNFKMSKSLLQKIKEEGRYVRFDVSKGFIYTINDESYYALSKNGLTKIEE